MTESKNDRIRKYVGEGYPFSMVAKAVGVPLEHVVNVITSNIERRVHDTCCEWVRCPRCGDVFDPIEHEDHD